MKSGFDQFAWGGGPEKEEKGGGGEESTVVAFISRRKEALSRKPAHMHAHIQKKKTGFVCPATTLAVGAHYPNDVSTQAETKEARIRNRPTICHAFVSAEHNSHEGIGGRSDENVYKNGEKLCRIFAHLWKLF